MVGLLGGSQGVVKHGGSLKAQVVLEEKGLMDRDSEKRGFGIKGFCDKC